MVAEEESVSKETVSEDFTTAYWEKRYTLRPHQVASFLARHQDRVLTTGKYLNVLRECGRDIRCPDADVSNDDAGAGGSGALLQAWAPGGVGNGSGSSGGLGDAANGEVINRAFFFASSTLLKALRTECRLVNRLRSMKHYFLLDQGDLYVNFMDLAEDELKQPLPKVILEWKCVCICRFCLRVVNSPLRFCISLAFCMKSTLLAFELRHLCHPRSLWW